MNNKDQQIGKIELGKYPNNLDGNVNFLIDAIYDLKTAIDNLNATMNQTIETEVITELVDEVGNEIVENLVDNMGEEKSKTSVEQTRTEVDSEINRLKKPPRTERERPPVGLKGSGLMEFKD